MSRFATTRWSLILTAGSENEDEAYDALNTLCQNYWYPLYAFVRRRGMAPEKAEDTIQGFFAGFLEKKLVKKFEPEAGRFRTFLLATLKYYLAHEYEKSQALKRGGHMRAVSLDAEQAENRYRHEPTSDRSPEKEYERRWALLVLDRALDRLRLEAKKSGRSQLFEQLGPYLVSGGDAVPYAELALTTGQTEGALRVAVHRLRKRFGKELRAEVAETVADDGDVDGELKHLIGILSS